MPTWNARSALNRPPVNSTSLAKRGPSTHGCAKYSTPGIPIRTTGSAKNASSAATIRSQPPGQHQAARDARALHHRDGRLGQLPPAAAHAQVDLHLAGVPGVRPGLADVVPPQHRLPVEGLVRVPLRGADVVPGAEVVARAGQHDHRDLVVVDGPGERRVERVRHRRVLRVPVPGPVKRDHRDRPEWSREPRLPSALLVSSRLSTLPDGLRGSASRNSTCLAPCSWRAARGRNRAPSPRRAGRGQ